MGTKSPVASFSISRRNVREWIKGQFSVYFLRDFVFVDFCSQVGFFSDVFLVSTSERKKDKKKERHLM